MVTGPFRCGWLRPPTVPVAANLGHDSIVSPCFAIGIPSRLISVISEFALLWAVRNIVAVWFRHYAGEHENRTLFV